MSESYTTIRYERDGDVGTLTLARPAKRNAQNPLMWEELAQLGTELLSDETLRCLVVMGEGPTFSAGLDLVEGMAGLLSDAAEQISASSRGEQRSAWWRCASGSCPTWAPPSGCRGSSVRAGHGS